jgi:hypothetical protein
MSDTMSQRPSSPLLSVNVHEAILGEKPGKRRRIAAAPRCFIVGRHTCEIRRECHARFARRRLCVGRCSAQQKRGEQTCRTSLTEDRRTMALAIATTEVVALPMLPSSTFVIITQKQKGHGDRSPVPSS